MSSRPLRNPLLLAPALLLACNAAHAELRLFENDEESVTFDVTGWFSGQSSWAEGDQFLADGPSRIGWRLSVDTWNDWHAGAYIEWGTRLLSANRTVALQGAAQASVDAGNDPIFLRQGNFFAQHDKWGDFRIGKQWGVYYDVAGITDWFRASGGLAAGVYNFGADGGASGTGRADSAITWRQSFDVLPDGQLHLGLMYASHTAEIDFDIEILDIEIEGLEESLRQTRLICGEGECEFASVKAISIGYSLDCWDGLYFGVAYNEAEIDLTSDRGRFIDFTDPDNIIEIPVAFSFDRDDTSLIFGAMYNSEPFQKGFFGAIVFGESKNHELTGRVVDDASNIFDATFSESMFSYGWDDCWSAYLGHNLLQSDDSELEDVSNGYELEIYIAGVNYNWNKRAALFLEYVLDDSNTLANTPGDIISLGMRIDI
ncbi:porin [Biformimicrobium ophioploci]|uniref:porin n=1 Tax=Biformimicrobium ophioploci TaxID=3036711 RepID=UPI002554B18E|nr:porin [Microbulbifer sp. NKW57]